VEQKAINKPDSLANVNQEMIDHAKKEVVMDEAFVSSIMKSEGYKSLEEGNFSIGNVSDEDFFRNKFSCQWQLDVFNEVPKNKCHLVTGFGPTNSPTGGTLSIILRALFFDKYAKIDSTIIISNLGAFNSRNIGIDKIQQITPRFFEFLRLLGYKGEVRTHDDRDMLVVSAFTSKVTQLNDFIKNQEATAKLYQKLGIQGNDFGTYLDMNFTVADIVVPFIKERKERVLVFVGIEEYYFPKLAEIVTDRLQNKYGTLFTENNIKVSAIFGKLINGLNGYPKMSKSIPDSSINLDDSDDVIKKKIMECDPEDEKVILQMIQLVSDWEVSKVNKAKQSFEENSPEWNKMKTEYLKYYLNIKRLWEKTRPKKKVFFNLKDNFFGNNRA